MDDIILSNHAKEQLVARGILESDIWEVIREPQQTVKYGTDKIIFQSILMDEDGKEYLIRVFVNVVKPEIGHYRLQNQ